ncbi:MAG: NDP-sugar synthase [Bacillota bacterium]|nr:NDP-sugar synthase [Bacillota bacterium]
MKGIILVGGRGTRLRPLTFFRPKPLVPLVNRPFLEYQLDLLRRYGVEEVILCVNYQAKKLMRHFADGNRFGLTIRYAAEQEPLGTAGALKNAAAMVDTGPVIVLNGDILTDVDLEQVLRTHRESGAWATLTLVEVDDPTRYGLVVLDRRGRVQRFLEKPSWDEVTARTVNAGIYVLEPAVFDYIPAGREVSVERETYPQLLQRGVPVSGHVARSYWLDIGTPDKYLQAHWDILEQRVSVPVPGREVSPRLWFGQGAEVSPQATLIPPVVLGEGVSVRAGATVGPYCVLGDQVTVREEASAAHAVLGRRCVLGRGARVQQAVLDQETRLEEGACVDGLLVAAGSVLGRGTRPAGLPGPPR